MIRRPLLLGAALLFWGWQTDFLVASACMALIVESAQLIKVRWDFSDDDFSRIWTVCTLLFLGAAIYAFTDSGGPAQFQILLQHPTVSTQASAGAATSRTASAMLRWLPMTLFLFVAAQTYSTRRAVPLTTVSLLVRRRWKRAVRLGHVRSPQTLDVFYPYFAVCVLAASIHPSDDKSYFWGLCALVAWALWLHRPRRFRLVTWSAAFALVLACGYTGQQGIGRLQTYIQNLQNLDPEWLMQFMRRRGSDPRQTTTAIGRIGRIQASGAIVIRVRPLSGRPPVYLREASYRLYAQDPGRARVCRWRASASDDMYFEPLADKPLHSQLYFLLPGKTNVSRASISCFLDGVSPDTGYQTGLLPLPTGCSRIEKLPAYDLKKNNLGAVMVEGPGMVVFDAVYGPGETIDAPFHPEEVISNTIVNPDLAVSPRETAAVDEVIAQLPLAGKSREQKLRVVNDFFETRFTYRTWQNSTNARSMDDAVSEFLLKTRSGHCEYFATATVLLLRRMGIPARYATGYAVHEPAGNGYVVRERDAHAWCLVWDDKTGAWEDFDTTPPVWVKVEADRASAFQRFWDFGSWLRYQFWRFRLGQTNLRPYLLMALVPALGLLLYQILFRKGRVRHQRRDLKLPGIWPGLDSEFYLVEVRLARAGIIRPANEPLSDWLGRALKEPRVAAAAESLHDLLRLHYRYRFDPQPLSHTDREELRAKAQTLLSTLTLKRTRLRRR